MRRIGLLLTVLIVGCGWVGAQNEKMNDTGLTEVKASAAETSPMEITYISKDYTWGSYDYPEANGSWGFMLFAKTPYYEGTVLKDPIEFKIEKIVTAPVKVKYSLYTLKKTFFQSNDPTWPDTNQRGYLNGTHYCSLGDPLADIDKNLDKIYEFPVVNETSSGRTVLYWDGTTDPAITGQKSAIRDCIYLVARNADTGEIIGTGSDYVETYYTDSDRNRQVKYYIYGYDDRGNLVKVTDREGNVVEETAGHGTIVKETVSAKIFIGYDDRSLKQIKKITAAIVVDGCFFGRLSFDVINQGADAMVKDINERGPGEVVAHAELTNPTVDPDNPDIKIFEWKDIKDESGHIFIPGDPEEFYKGYLLSLFIETDEMTFTGIKNGFLNEGYYNIIPTPRMFTGIQTIEKTAISITANACGCGFIIRCPAGVFVQSYTVYDLSGRTLKTGRLSGASEDAIPAAELRSGIYFVQVTVKENGEERVVTEKVVKK